MMNEMQKTIQEHGIDATATMLAEYINQKIPSEDVAIQFVLEELEAASQGNEMAKLFAQTSGFDEDDYKGAMYNSFEEVDGDNGPQQELMNLCMMLYPNENLMTEIRIKTVDLVMKEWEIGKYASINEEMCLVDTVKKRENHEWGIFANIMNDLGEYSKEYGENDRQYNVLRFMAYAYARRTAAAGLYLQGYWSREYYDHASQFFKETQLLTGYSVEFQEEASEQANELLLTYDERLNKNFVAQLVIKVELNQIEKSYNKDEYFSENNIFEMFNQNTKSNIIYDKYGNEYKEIVSPYTGRTWLDRNLGAKRVAISYDDKEAYGDYFQWGRNSDGHEKIESEIITSLSESKQPNHGDFILPPDEPFNWFINNEDNLWDGINALNNPCPKGYRLPTLEELVEETVFLEEHNNIYGIYDDFLKIPAAGCRNNLDGELYFKGSKIFLWTSDTLEVGSIFLSFDEDTVSRNASFRAAGANIRCIKDY